MKNVLLIGDSIRFGAPPNSPGYGVYVKETLEAEGLAKVFAPDDNCRFAEYTLRYLYDWSNQLEKEKIDVIHWNNGLWDILRLNDDEPLTPKDIYIYFLERIYKMMTKLFPNAKIIFALSTPVVEEWGNKAFFRYNSDIEEYNAAANELMNSLGVEVNDLYTTAKSFDNSLHCDWVHFDAESSKILADAVTDKIKKYL